MKKKVMIVEDDPGAQLMLGRMIRRIDHSAQVYSVDSAESAYRILDAAAKEGSPFDLVLADLNLPSSDGLMLKEVTERQHLGPVFLFVSAVSYEEWHKRSALHWDMPPLLRKPVSEEQLKLFWEHCFSGIGTFAG